MMLWGWMMKNAELRERGSGGMAGGIVAKR